MKREAHMQSLARQLRFLRKKHGLSQRELADILRIGLTSLRLLERGILPARLSCEVLFDLSDHFRIPMSRLFEDPEA